MKRVLVVLIALVLVYASVVPAMTVEGRNIIPKPKFGIGTIFFINHTEGILTIYYSGFPEGDFMYYKFDHNTKVIQSISLIERVAKNKELDIDDLDVGQEVQVFGFQENGTWYASKIVIINW